MSLFSGVGSIVSSLRSGVSGATSQVNRAVTTVNKFLSPINNLIGTVRSEYNAVQSLVKTVQNLNPTRLYSQVASGANPITVISNIGNVTQSGLNSLNSAVNTLNRSTQSTAQALSGFTTVFSAPSLPSSGVVNSPFISKSCGYSGDIGWSVPDNQLVKITSTLETGGTEIGFIAGILSSPFSMAVDSEWRSFITPPIDILNTVLQALPGQLSGVSQFSSRRIWVGSTPLTLNVELSFYAVRDAYTEVLEPCCRLMRMALPSYSLGRSSGFNVPLLSPPGPDPFSFNLQTNQPGQVAPGSDIIQITVAGMFIFSNVIIKSATPEFGDKYDSQGHPMSAKINLEFQTYQIATKGDISAMVTPNLQGALSAQVTAFGGGTSPFTGPTAAQLAGATL